MARTLIFRGDDVTIPVQLKKEVVGQKGTFAAFVINPASIVKATLISAERSLALSTTVTVTEVAGSAWATSLVVAQWTAAQSAIFKLSRDARVMIEVDDTVNTDGKLTFESGQVVIAQGFP